MSLQETDPRDCKGRFLPGNSGFNGRPKGSRNKLGEAFLADLHADWEENGKAVIETVRAEKPDAYLKVVASVLPKQFDVRVSEYDELSDEELERAILRIVESRRKDSPGVVIEGTANPVGSEPTVSIPPVSEAEGISR